MVLAKKTEKRWIDANLFQRPQEIKELAELSNENPELRVIIVCMSPEDIGKEWFKLQG
jgi:hypothetical protein